MTAASPEGDGESPSAPEELPRPFPVEVARIEVPAEAPGRDDPGVPDVARSGAPGAPARRRPQAGADTMAIVGRLAALDPTTVPAPPPLPIPGLTDLVEVGRGGMGIVYRARETRLGRTVAVKVLGVRCALTDEGRRRAEREAALLTRVVHPNIVHILYVTDVEGLPAIVMEWIDGPSLDTCAAGGAMALRDAVAVVADLARGVAALHAAGIVHRDIKPANVLLAPVSGGGRRVPTLVDFGLARPGDGSATDVTRESIAIGTPSFMAPEQTGLDPSLGPPGPAADIHALGGLLFWLLSGSAPYDADTASASLHRASQGDATVLGSRFPVDVQTIVAKCLERSPGSRYASAAVLAEDLNRFLDDRPIHARRAPALERLLKWSRRRPAGAALVAGALVAGLALAGGTAYHLQSLRAANAALAAGRDRLVEAQGLAKKSFERLTDASAERFLARGAALDGADRDHLRRIRDEYLAWPLEPDPSDGLRYRARGLLRLATIFERLHWGPDALDAVRAALVALDEIDSRGDATPEDGRHRIDCGRLEVALLCRAGRLDEAFGAARRTAAWLEARASADTGTQRFLAVALGDMANVEAAAGHLEPSRDHHRRAVELSDALLDADPDDGDLLRLSLPLLYNAAISPSTPGAAEGRRYLEKLRERAADGLARFAEGREEMGRGLLLALTVLAQSELVAGRPAEALEAVRRRAAAARSLAAEMPGVPHFRGEVVAAASQGMVCLTALGRPEDATADLDEAVTLAAAAVADEPAVAERTRVLVDVLLFRAGNLAVTGRREEAIADLRRTLDALAPWMENLPAGHEPPSGFAAAATKARADLGALVAAEASAP